MLITKDKLNLVKYLDKKNPRHSFTNLYFDKNRAVACNGYFLVQVEDNPSPPHKDFPFIRGMENVDYTPDEILVTSNTANKVSKNLPKNKTISIINNASIEADEDGTVSFGLIDLESSMVIRQRKEEGSYPDVDAAIPTEEPITKIDVNIRYLQKIVGALSEFLSNSGTNEVEISLYGPEIALTCRCKKDDAEMLALVMPLRVEED